MTTTIFDLPQPYHELYAFHDILRKLGFQPREIFVDVTDNVVQVPQLKNVLVLVLKAQDKEFIITVHPFGPDAIRAEILEKWGQFVRLIRDEGMTSQADLRRSFESTRFHREGLLTHLLTALKMKGFDFPAVPGDQSFTTSHH